MIAGLIAAVATVSAYDALTTGIGLGILGASLASGTGRITYNMKR